MIKWEDKNNNWPKKQKNIGLTQDSLCIESDILYRLEIIACFLYPIFLAVFSLKKKKKIGTPRFHWRRRERFPSAGIWWGRDEELLEEKFSDESRD